MVAPEDLRVSHQNSDLLADDRGLQRPLAATADHQPRGVGVLQIGSLQKGLLIFGRLKSGNYKN